MHGYSMWMVDSEAGQACRWGGHGEGLRRNRWRCCRGKLGAKLIDWFTVNTGTIPHRSRCPGSIGVRGIDTSSVEGAGSGGAHNAVKLEA